MDKEKQDEKELTSSGKMSFLDHLDELRRRIIVSVASVGIGSASSTTLMGGLVSGASIISADILFRSSSILFYILTTILLSYDKRNQVQW